VTVFQSFVVGYLLELSVSLINVLMLPVTKMGTYAPLCVYHHDCLLAYLFTYWLTSWFCGPVRTSAFCSTDAHHLLYYIFLIFVRNILAAQSAKFFTPYLEGTGVCKMKTQQHQSSYILI